MRILASLLLVACSGSSAPKIGDLEKDLALLDETEALAHLAPAYGLDASVDDLLNRRVRPTRPPNPTTWQQAMTEAHQALPDLVDPVTLRILNYNVALLDRPYLFTRVQMPHVEERLEAQLQVLFTDDWDILLIQELFEWDHTERFVEVAEQNGYTAWVGSRRDSERHGTAIFVRDEVAGMSVDRTEAFFDAQRRVERWPGPNIKRGYLTYSFRLLNTSHTITLATTHMSAFYDFWHLRDRQARELGLVLGEEPGIVILGGDINAGPYYANDAWVDADGKRHTGYLRNASAFPLLAYYGGMVDTFALHGPPGDVEAGLHVPTGLGELYREAPYGDGAFCERESARRVHTVTDCNYTFFQSYAGDEPPARIDHVLLRDPNRYVRVNKAWLAYTEPLEGVDYELSDHYAVAVELQIAR
ncbi:MAG: hypothetical protein EA397_13030 [Deltaproteobacteria bacterium]|nr:MAG: hypothetical protein EA397_13030 [Deltaproteobacteria bacterium]